jgi:hypothetical protein
MMGETKYFLVLLVLLTLGACSQPLQIKSPAGYNLSKPQVFTMPPVLEEISGIAFKNGNADTIYAEQDEEGKLFYMRPGDKEPGVIKFGKKGDYEDVAIYNDTVIMLRSDGTLFLFSLRDVKDGVATNVTEQEGVVPPGEHEAMYADEKTGSVYILCKNCTDDKKEKKVSGYKLAFHPGGRFTAENFFIDEREIEALNGGKKIRLKASAMAKNIQTNEWYIISSVNKLLVITDEAWKVKNIYPLAPASFFVQPEGIAFDNKGNLYISNEGGGIGPGNILKFTHQNK